MRLLLLCAAVLALAGCGDLETGYGLRQGESVNGLRALHDELASRCDQRDAWLLSPRLDERELVVHVANGTELPAADACTWIRTWLEDAEGPRQVVIVLRDGNVAPFLCRKWSGEARNEGLDELAARLDARAEREDADTVGATTTPRQCGLFATDRREPAPVRTLHGLGLSQAPATLRLTAYPVVPPPAASPVEADQDSDEDEAEDTGTVLIAADGLPLMAAWKFGEHGRLVVVANATGLVDGALADPTARRFTQAVIDEILRFHGGAKPRSAWVGSLRVREEDPKDLSLFSLLAKEPFSWALWHLFALLVVVVLAKSAWLGRREARRDRRAARFARHIDALAEHLAAESRHDPAVLRATANAIALLPHAPTHQPARKSP